MILAERTARRAAEARAEDAEAQISGARLEIERLKLLLAKARREQYGQSSERGAKIIAQLELQLAELEETVAQEETTAEIAAPVSALRPRSARKPARRPLPEHLPRERIIHPAPCACPKCGGVVRKLGEDVTETLECVPRRWKVVEHVREKFTCRSCEAITQSPAASHPIARGRAGPNLLALVMVSKYGHHLPLTRQSAIYARERRRDRCLDAGRLGGGGGSDRHAAGGRDPRARVRGRAHPCRRHDRTGAGEGEDPDRPALDLCPG